ncbi:hypothetical protein EVAR_61107_1 [Eumeta japonica]|uniref:Uncharacterized protein n=1 Tax=Eumeta variegata TaxID=151549 RepID=A0A4C1YRY0_EUMVA|nr:hypothetical protein EVAR_61107_1 [Eumeta japonica]
MNFLKRLSHFGASGRFAVTPGRAPALTEQGARPCSTVFVGCPGGGESAPSSGVVKIYSTPILAEDNIVTNKTIKKSIKCNIPIPQMLLLLMKKRLLGPYLARSPLGGPGPARGRYHEGAAAI